MPTSDCRPARVTAARKTPPPRRSRMPAIGVLVCASLLLGISSLGARASVADLVAGRTGGFGEMTCQQCHWENPLNEPSGRLTIEGVPEDYTPGTEYMITVTLSRPDLERGGFQLAAREDGKGEHVGAEAGTLRALDELAATVRDEARRITYAQHTPAGTAARTPGAIRWRLAWIAPDRRVPVVFHAAANASNDDDSPLGDHIYTSEAHAR